METVASAEDTAVAYDPISGAERSVAVLPFDNLSPDSANAYFAYAIHDAAVGWLEAAMDEGFRIRPMLEGYGGPFSGPPPGLDRVREDDRYRRIEARLEAAQDSMRGIVERRGC